jgi:hypothetical protein
MSYTTLIRRCVWKRLNKKGDVKFIRTVWMEEIEYSFGTMMKIQNDIARAFGGDQLGSLPTCEMRKGYEFMYRSVRTETVQAVLAKLNADPACLVDPSEPFEGE